MFKNSLTLLALIVALGACAKKEAASIPQASNEGGSLNLTRNGASNGSSATVDVLWSRSKGNACVKWELYLGLNDINTQLPLVDIIRNEANSNDTAVQQAYSSAGSAGSSFSYRNGILAISETTYGQDGVRVEVPAGMKVVVERVVASDCISKAPLAISTPVVDYLPGGDSTVDLGSNLQIKFQMRGRPSGTYVVAPWIGTKQTGSPSYYSYVNNVITDSAGNVIVAGKQSFSETGCINGMVTKYNVSGVKQWVRFLGDCSSAMGLATDAAGNIFVAGVGAERNFASSYGVLTKIDPYGTTLWASRFAANRAYFTAYGLALVADKDGNVYMTGKTEVSLDGTPISGLIDAFVAKYSNDGVRQWVRLLGASDGIAYGLSIALDPTGDLVVGGIIERASLDQSLNRSQREAFLAKYKSSGVKQWVKQYRTGGATYYTDATVAVDNTGSIFLASNLVGNASSKNIGYQVMKLSSSAKLIWTQQVGLPANVSASVIASAVNNVGAGMVVDSAGAVYLTGATVAPNLNGTNRVGTSDAFLAKLNSAGNFIFTKLQGEAGKYAEGKAVAIDAAGALFVAGETNANLGAPALNYRDLFISKYNANGSRQ